MGQTISDVNRSVYFKYRSKGLTHKQAIKKFPKSIRSKVMVDIRKSGIESHFGVKPIWFFVVMMTIVLLGCLLMII